jgi:hypothetical protein
VLPDPCDESPYPTCDGVCPPGEVCTQGPNQSCECVAQFPACGNTTYPQCEGLCPAGEKCVNAFGTDACHCVPPPPPCGDALFPSCGGTCPVNEKCVVRQAPIPGCECKPCADLGTSGLGGIHVGWPHTKDQLRWTGALECALVYNTYRLTSPRLIDGDADRLADDYGSCHVEDIVGLDLRDASTPPPGQVHWYLVTGENFVTEGSLGENSIGLERPNLAPCP